MNNKDTYILDFNDIHLQDLPLVGGKGANLGEMTSAGFPVPEGFCLTTEAFRRFMSSDPNLDKVYSLLDGVQDLEEIRIAGEKVRAMLLDTAVPEDVSLAVVKTWKNMGENNAYAVRSSATAEDLPGASFAGQQDTYLNILGKDALIDGIHRCWVSLFTDRAIIYRNQNNFSHRNVTLSVVVQKMVMADKSGILFTADPLTGHRHTLTIEASFGLGEALVSGAVTPDTYRVNKKKRIILDTRIAEKLVAIYPEKTGGTRKEFLPASRKTQIVLSKTEIMALTEMGCKAESHYHGPQDIEWAAENGKMYLLQSRPITSLYPINGLSSPDGRVHIYFSLGHQQNMTRAMAPLSLSLFPAILPVKGEIAASFIKESGGRLFIDITRILRHRTAKRLVSGLLSQFDSLIPQKLEVITERSEFKGPHGIRLSFKQLKFVLLILHRVFKALSRSNLSGFTSRTNNLMDTFVHETTVRLEALPRGREQVQAAFTTLSEIFPLFLNWVPEAAAGIVASKILPRMAAKWLSPEKVEELTLGIPGNVVNEMNLALSDLSELVKESPLLAEWFSHLGDDAESWLEQASQIEGSSTFFTKWKDFLSRYGARGTSEIDIMMPRWIENPLPVLAIIAGNLQKKESFRNRFEAHKTKREASFAELISAAGGGLAGHIRVRFLKRLYHVVIETGGMREHHKFMLIRYLWVLKKILKENAEELVEEGKLTAVDDIWFLTRDELLAILDSTAEKWDSLIVRRRENLDRYQKLSPPIIVTSDGETPVVHYQLKNPPPGALLGNPVSTGVVEGAARIILDPAVETLQPGEILVAPFTDPGWTPLFINAGGLVMEIGGELAHGSVVAREYGIPAVVGVNQATSLIKSGQRLRVDGEKGIIELL